MVETMLDRLQRQMREQFAQALSDMAHYGMHITKDGERIAPEDFYPDPPPPTEDTE